MIVADTSGLLAYFNRAEPAHDRVVATLAGEEPVIVSPFVLAEFDYLAATRLGAEAELAVLREVAGSAWLLPAFDRADLTRAVAIVERYADQEIGLADASLVVLAQRFGTRRILTLDRRHFEVVRPLGGGRFTILP